MKKTVFVILTLILSACIVPPTVVPTATASLPYIIKAADNPYAPRPEDASLQIGGVELTSIDLAEQVESTPVRVELRFLGSLPRTCNELRIDVAPPNDQFQILVKIYSLVDTKIKCENVFQQFGASVLLGVYSTGRYTVWVNGGLIGDFVTY
jgi:hypothetical protein